MHSYSISRNQIIYSNFLERNVIFDLIIPKNNSDQKKFKTLYMNDGQDLDKLAFESILNKRTSENKELFIWVSIHTNERRLREYGTAFVPDYKNRGDLATEYMHFVIKELMPYIQDNSFSSELPENNFFAGFSLGGLSALDITWENSEKFSKAAVFSGALWWRSKSYEDGYVDQDRIMHNKIKNGPYKEGLSFWFECGTNDEKEDRNKNGIIDSIDDTLELIEELKEKGFNDITYVEIEGGEHNFNTWQSIFPKFLRWAID